MTRESRVPHIEGNAAATAAQTNHPGQVHANIMPLTNPRMPTMRPDAAAFALVLGDMRWWVGKPVFKWSALLVFVGGDQLVEVFRLIDHPFVHFQGGHGSWGHRVTQLNKRQRCLWIQATADDAIPRFD